MIKNILIGIVITIGVLIVISQIVNFYFFSTLNKQKGDRKEILPSSINSLKKALIVYQPRITSISTRMAHQIAKGINDNGYEVDLNYPGNYLSTDLSIYSIIVFGSPVYGEKPSKALTDYMAKTKGFSSKIIVLYTTGSIKNTMGYSGLDVMENTLKGAKIYKKIKFLTGAKKENDKTAYNLGKELVEK